MLLIEVAVTVVVVAVVAVGFDYGIALGVNAIHAENVDNKGGYVIGLGPSAGVGWSPTAITLNINEGVSEAHAKIARPMMYKLLRERLKFLPLSKSVPK